MGKTIKFDKIVNKHFLLFLPDNLRTAIDVGDIVTVTIERIKSSSRSKKKASELTPSDTLQGKEGVTKVSDRSENEETGRGFLQEVSTGVQNSSNSDTLETPKEK